MPVKNVTIVVVKWEPDRLFPEGGYACDVEVQHQDGRTETKSTRMCRSEKSAWDAAKNIKAAVLRANNA